MQNNKATMNAIVQDFRNKGVFESKESILSRINLSTDETEKDGDFDSLPFLKKQKKSYYSYNIPHLEQSIRKNKAKEFDFDFKNEQLVNAETEAMELALERKQKEQKIEQWADNVAKNSEGGVLSQKQRYWITMISCALVSAFMFANLSSLNEPQTLKDISAVSISNVPAKTQEQQAKELSDQMIKALEKTNAETQARKKADEVAHVIKKSGSYDRATQEKINAHLLSIMDINAQLAQGGKGVVDNLTAAKNLIDQGAAK